MVAFNVVSLPFIRYVIYNLYVKMTNTDSNKEHQITTEKLYNMHTCLPNCAEEQLRSCLGVVLQHGDGRRSLRYQKRPQHYLKCY